MPGAEFEIETHLGSLGPDRDPFLGPPPGVADLREDLPFAGGEIGDRVSAFEVDTALALAAFPSPGAHPEPRQIGELQAEDSARDGGADAELDEDSGDRARSDRDRPLAAYLPEMNFC